MPLHKGHAKGDSGVLRLSFSSLLVWVAPVPEECSSSWADKVTLRKLGICLVLEKFQHLPLEFVHTRVRGPGGKAFDGRRVQPVCQLLPPVCPLFQLLFFPGKISVCLLKPPPFPHKGLGIHLPFYLSCRELKGQTQELGKITSAAQKPCPVLCKHLWKSAMRQSLGNRYVKSKISARHQNCYRRKW